MTTLAYYTYVSWQARGADKVSRYLAHFFGKAGASRIVHRMQQLVRKMAVGRAKELVVELENLLVLVGNADLFALVFLIESCCAFFTEGVENVVGLVGKEAGFDKRLSDA